MISNHRISDVEPQSTHRESTNNTEAKQRAGRSYSDIGDAMPGPNSNFLFSLIKRPTHQFVPYPWICNLLTALYLAPHTWRSSWFGRGYSEAVNSFK